MDDFDFDEDADLQEALSCLEGDKSSSPIKKCPSSPSNSIISGSSSGSPLRGRTKKRKTRKIILSGAQAIKEGQEKRRQADEEAAAAAVAKAAALEKKKIRTTAASTLSSNNKEPTKRQASPESKIIITKGRRHKQRKTERNNNNNNASVEREMSNEYAFSQSQSSLDSKSVRFAESKEHRNVQAERDSSNFGECEGSSSAADRKKQQQTQQPSSSCLKTKPTYPPASSSQSMKPNASKQTPPTSPASNSSVSYSSFSKIHGNGAGKKRHKPRRFQLGYSPNDSPQQQHEPSVNSSSASSSTSKSPEKTQVVTLGRSYGYSSRDFDTTPDAASAAQNVGNYRMLIDELSYLCSAILHCKQKHRIGLATKAEVLCKHNSITAGAACDIGELISQSGTRTALLMLSSSGGRTQQKGQHKNGGKNVGALGAILEAMACAPPVVDWVDVCKEVIIGTEVSNELPDGLIGDDSNATRFELDNNNLAAIPLSSLEERTKFDIIASKALSIISLFVSIDCTGSNRAAITPGNQMERKVVKGARNGVLHHQQSLRGIARLISDDPVVNTYLRSAAAARGVAGVNGVDELQPMDNVDERSMASKSSHTSTLSSISMSKASSQQTVDELAEPHEKNADPTKAGRHRSRKRKKLLAIREDEDGKDSAFAMSSTTSSKASQSPVKSNSPDKSGKSNCLDFKSEGSSAKPKLDAFVKKVRLNSVEKYTEKLSLALSRAKIPQLDTNDDNMLRSDDDIDSVCQHCKMWEKDAVAFLPRNVCITSSSLAIDAAEYIITGKDSSSGEGADDTEMDGDDDDDDSDDDDFLRDINQNSGDDVSSKNPILFANEMLRKSGSLPDYSRAYAATLSAILLAYKPHDDEDPSRVTPIPCHRCIAYLQKRASSLSGIIDSLCCLSPKASIALSCPESYLVPGLLKVIADLSFGNLDEIALTSVTDEILTSLKTLTSLTHENAVACEQLVRPYSWDNPLPISMESMMVVSDQTTTGVCIIFSYLLKIVSTKQRKATPNHDDDKASERYSYDTSIFCLNILTNIVEMVPHSAKHMIEHIFVTDAGINAISWLARWVVSTTSGFQNSIMKGSFGSQGKLEESAGGDELKAGEEGNLVTAGNGFVLLAYLMLEDESASSTSLSIRDAVIKELPFDGSGASGGIQYMIKTLKAFCNFYHYSVGDLSVAVIAPIVKLIAGLQKLDVAEQRKSWL